MKSGQSPGDVEPTPPPSPTVERPRGLGDAIVVLLMLAPALAAVWLVPWFVTQDGLAHLYNAEVLLDSLRGGERFGRWHEVRWDPLPNWGGHLALMGLLTVLPPRAADRMMTTIMLVAVAMATVRLRVAVGGRSSAAARAWAALAATGYSWLMGFASFQLGAALFALTLAIWWPGRNDLRPGRMAAVAAMLTAGYFCHLVSAGLTLAALGFLALAAPVVPGGPSRRGRAGRLAICAAPLLGMMAVYLRLSRRGGSMSPVFPRVEEFLSIRGWMGRLGWVDPVSLAIKNALPFTTTTGPAFLLLSAVVWLTIAAGLLTLAGWAEDEPGGPTRGERRAWLGLAMVLIAAGIFGPDSMGPGHGDFLPQRVALLGLIAAIPAVAPPRSRWGRAASLAMGAALALQATSVWDYAVESQRTVAPLAEAAARVGEGRRVAVLIGDLETRFRISAPRHVACWAGVTGNNLIWNNYEVRHYYFPARLRPGVVGPDSRDLEDVALRGRRRRDEGTAIWERVLARHHGAIDLLVEWRGDAELDAVSARWFDPVETIGEVRLLRPRESGGNGPEATARAPGG